MPRTLLTLVLSIAVVSVSSSAQSQKVPTVDDLLSLKTVGAVQISPDARWVAYTITHTDFTQDAFVTHLWVTELQAGVPGRSFQLTRGDKSVGGAQWSPDSQWLTFTSTRVGDRNQLFAINPNGGEAVQLTKTEQGVGSHQWSPDGKQIAFTQTETAPAAEKGRRDALGDFDIVRREYAHTHLWTIDVAAAMTMPQAGTMRTKGKDFTVGGYSWSPDSTRIAFSAQVNPDLTQGHTADIYLLTLDGDRVTRLVDLRGPDNGPQWSPDGTQIIFSSQMGRQDIHARNARLAVVPVTGGVPRSITDGFDEQPGLVAWTGSGVYFSGARKTASHLFQVSPASGQITTLTGPPTVMASGFSIAKDRTLAFTMMSPTSLPEVYVSGPVGFAPRKVTSMSEQVSGWTLGTREVIEWKSQDGTVIEGVLIKPADFDPARRYPLLSIIHGGPTGIDRPGLLSGDTRYYPSDIWAARGALVLKVNYRGSAGYGEEFRRLNYRNLGVGDAWDVISGVDHLIAKGWVDKDRVASMGWSQGGYISAFLTTSSDRFKAIFGGRRYLELGDVLLQHGHHAVHDQLSR